MTIRCGIRVLLCLAAPFVASGQTVNQPTDFGTEDEGIVVVGWEKFFPLSSGYASDLNDGRPVGDGSR